MINALIKNPVSCHSYPPDGGVDGTGLFQMAGTPGNRTQLPGTTGDNGFEGRGEHQPLNHSQSVKIKRIITLSFTSYSFLDDKELYNLSPTSF